MQPAHRAVYEYIAGKIPAGKVLDHLCENRWCLNPGHLEPVDNGTNLARAVTNKWLRTLNCNSPLLRKTNGTEVATPEVGEEHKKPKSDRKQKRK